MGLVLLLVLIKSFAYSIVSFLAVGTMVCLVVGLFNPDAFRFLFGEKTSKSTVGWTFGALLFALGALGSSMDPKRESAAVESPALHRKSWPHPRPPNRSTLNHTDQCYKNFPFNG